LAGRCHTGSLASSSARRIKTFASLMATANRTNSTLQLERLLEQRVLILDGAMGTMIQALKLGEADYRGSQFATHSHDLKGCNDLLVITQADAIETIHRQYFEAG